MKKTLTLTFICIVHMVYSQEIRTYTNLTLSTGFSKIAASNAIQFGEMVQKNSTLPFRLTAGLSLKFQKAKPAATYTSLGSNYKAKTKINSTALAIPVGFEIFKNSLGLGVSQELIGLNFNKKLDNTNLDLPVDFTAGMKRFNTLFSSKNNLSSQIYGVFTLFDSFALKIGMQIERNTLKINDINNRNSFAKLQDNLFFISIRTNIEK
jgi:hypothetical protein